jgi:hypothetical protein
MSASGLRREAMRGRLVMERIAGKDYTTLAAIQKMRAACRVEAKDPACGSSPHAEPQTGDSLSARSGASSTASSSAALALAKAKLSKLKKRSRDTFSEKQRRHDSETVIRPSFGSRT